jgi:hypothetical protein
MSRKDNDSLEEFFRKATRHHDLEYNEEDWKKLERMLDVQQPVRPVGWFSTHGRKVLAGLALLTAVVATWLLLPDREGVDTVVTGSADKVDQKEAQVQDEAKVFESLAEDESQMRERLSQDINRGNAQLNRDVNSSAQSGTSAPIRRRTETALTTELRASNDIKKDPSNVSGFNHTQVESGALVDRAVNAKSDDEKVSQVQTQLADSASVDVSADALEPPASERSGFVNDRGRFAFTVVAAPDFSRTLKGGSMGTGDAMGAFIHYQAFPRWGITTGVLYTNKKYWGKGAEYQPPYGYWKALTNGVVPDRIDGTCSMYEVPVAVTFDIVSTRRTRLFASAGLSSYFVQSEEYYYHFDTPNPGAVNGWTGKKPSTLWFGIGTLSAGFDFKATRTLSLGVEPYFKVPLEGMGWADIDLYSTGVMFAARYHFAKKANKHPPMLQGP